MTAPKKVSGKKKPVVIKDGIAQGESLAEDPEVPELITKEEVDESFKDTEIWETPQGNITEEVKETDPPGKPQESVAIADIEPEVTTVPYYPLEQGFTHLYASVAGAQDIQEALAEDGFYEGPINGNCDFATRLAFGHYQESIGSYSSGIPSVADLEALGFKVLM